MIIMGEFLLDKIVHLINALESKGSQIKQTDRDTYFNWHRTSKSLQDSKIASLKDDLQKAKEKLRTQEVPKTKTVRWM